MTTPAGAVLARSTEEQTMFKRILQALGLGRELTVSDGRDIEITVRAVAAPGVHWVKEASSAPPPRSEE